MLIGTFWIDSSRFCAVTTTSRTCVLSLLSSAAKAADAATSIVEPNRLAVSVRPARPKLMTRYSVIHTPPVSAGLFGPAVASSDLRPHAASLNSRPRRLRIGFQDRSQRGLQRVEPGFVVFPVVEAFAEDRAADLLGAGRPDRALVLVETKAVRLDRQAAVVQKAPRLPLGVLHQPHKEDPKHPTRQNPDEVVHQGHVIAIVPADLSKTIGKTLASGEMLFET